MNSSKRSLYEELGVDPSKAGVREIFSKLVTTDYASAFCIVKEDRGIRGNVKTKHGDGSGTKSRTRVMVVLEGGDPAIIKGDAYDAMSMNTSDIGACGFVYLIEYTDHVAICPLNIGNTEGKKLILKQLALGFAELVLLYNQFGIELEGFGGETADLNDTTSSIILDVDVRATMRKKLLIQGNVIPGDSIFGFASDGRARWEEEDNSGIMANGHTLGVRATLVNDYFYKYPFLFHGEKPLFGKYTLDDNLPGVGMTASEALLSPTRQWAIIIRMIINKLRSKESLHKLHGICVNTGGGLSKCLHLGKGICYHKNIPEPPPYFQFLHEASGDSWRNTGTTFNCGIGIEIFGDNSDYTLSDVLLEVSAESGVQLHSLGHCSASSSSANEAWVTMMGERFRYPE